MADSILERRARRMLMANADGDSPREVAEDADGDPGAAVDPTAGGFPQALQRLSLTVVAPSGLSSSCLSSLCASPLSGVGQRGRSVLSRGLQGVDVLAQAALLVSEAAEAGPQQQQRQARAQRVSDSVAAVSAAERASVVPLPSIATRRPPESGAASPRAPSEASSPKAQGDMGSAATASSPMGQRKGAGQRGLAAGAPASPQAGPAAKAAPAKPRYGFGSTISVPRVRGPADALLRAAGQSLRALLLVTLYAIISASFPSWAAPAGPQARQLRARGPAASHAHTTQPFAYQAAGV